MRVWLTQSLHALVDLEPALSRLGHEVFRWPLVRTTSREPAAVRAAASALLGCRWLLLTSPAAVRAWCAAGLPLSEGPLLGAVGPGTATALLDAGAAPELIGDGDAASLAAAFLGHPLAAGPVGLALGDRALGTLRDALEASGHQVVTATVYRTESLPVPAARSRLASADAVLLASPSAVTVLYDPLDGLLPGLPGPPTIIAIGPTTAAAVRATGRRCLQASEPTAAAIVACIEHVLAGERTTPRKSVR